MEYIDRPDSGMTGIVNPETALMTGRLKTSDMKALMRFQQVFPLTPQKVMDYSERMRDAVAKKGAMTAKDKADLIFHQFLPEFYRSDRAKGWSAALHFKIADAGDYTVAVDDGCVIHKGLKGKASAEIAMDVDTLAGVLKYGILDQANQLEAAGFVDAPEEDVELADDMLDAVVGGRGGSSHHNPCAAEAAVVSPCGAEACGAAACGAEATGAGACGAEACAAAACGAEACGAAACAAEATGGSACVADASGAAVCGGDVTGIGACVGEACVGAACGAALCGGDACGLEAEGADLCGLEAGGVDVCAAEAGGVDVCGAEVSGVDACAVEIGGAEICGAEACAIDLTPVDACAADACAIDVIPVVPGI